MGTRNSRCIVAALLMAAVTSCSDQPTAVAPVALTAQLSEGAAPPDVKGLARYTSQRAPGAPEQGHAVIGAEGGSLRVGDFEIIVPAGAVSHPTNFRISLPRDPHAVQYAFAEFSPHREFKKAVTIRMPDTGTDVAGETVIGWWSGTRWVPLSTQITEDGRIETKVWHFSYYGSCAKGVILVGN